MKDFSEKLKNLPLAPGVYLMKDIDGRIIYVGKSKSLKNRVSQYFHKSANHHPKTKKLVENIDTFEYIITDTEVEALILECNLIKLHLPKYNILLKDGKQYPYIKITDEKFPRILITRKRENDNARYFGQFVNGFAAKENVEIIRKIFKLRSCTKVLPRDAGKSRPCLMFHIKRCGAPCAGNVSARKYSANVARAVEILEGKSDIIADLTAQMQRASENLEFESAAKLRDKIKHIQTLENSGASESIRKHLSVVNPPAATPKHISDYSGSAENTDNTAVLAELAEALSLAAPPARIECYDISNISGELSVGAFVVFQNGESERKSYRKFNIKTVDGADDYASMREVMFRRINRAYKEQDEISDDTSGGKPPKFLPLPDLILLDGGKGHVSVIRELLATMGEEIPVFGIVKDDKHRTRGLVSDTHEFDIPKNSKLFRLLTRMQDEVHRFAITAYRKRHEVGMLRSELEDIPNVGESTRRKLLAHFKSVERIRSATLAELCEAVNKRAAQSIFDYFHKNT